MKQTYKRCLNAGAAFAFLAAYVLGLVSPMVPKAYADAPGTEQPVWCKITGSGIQAQLAANGRGKDGPLTIDVDGYVKVNNQIVAHDRSDKLDAACARQYTNTVAIPEGIADVCGKGNDTVPLTGQNYTVAVDSGWLQDGQDQAKTVRTITYQAKAGSTFAYNEQNVTDGWVYSTDRTQVTYRYTDWATACPAQPKQINTPEGIADVCGVGNDTVPLAGAHYTVKTDSGWQSDAPDPVKKKRAITYQAEAGYMFMQSEGWTYSADRTEATYVYTDQATPCKLQIPTCTVSSGSALVTDMGGVGIGEDGTATLETDGLHMRTVIPNNPGEEGKEAYVGWSRTVTPYSLAEVGKPSLDYTNTNGTQPGMRMTVALNDGSGRTIELVGEPTVPGYGDNWWVLDPATGTGTTVDYGVGSGMGYINFAPLNAYLNRYPGATVKAVGFSMGWGVNGQGVMHSATFGCYTWTFEKAPVVPQSNPVVTNPCGLDIALAVDVSGSIDYDELAQVKAALIGMTNALRGTGTEFSVTVYADEAVVILPMTGDIDAVNAAIENISGDGMTNWEDALAMAGSTLPHRMGNPDMVIIASDGDPTTSNSSGDDLENAVAMANQLKANGVRIVAIGIGDDLNVENLKSIAGPNVNTGSIATTDVITTDFATMAADLANYAKISCPGGRVLGVQSPAAPAAAKTVVPAQLEDTGNSLVLPLMMSTGLMGLAIMVTLRNDMRNDSRLGRLSARLRKSLAAPFVVPTA